MNSKSKFDVLAFGSHPDDVELSAGGTLAQMVDDGYRVGIVDLTRGELGSRGTVDIRFDEATDAARILGVSRRINLRIPDGRIKNSPKNRLKVIQELRETRPDMILIPSPDCRHPDHPAGARLICDAVFQSGLTRIVSSDTDGAPQRAWRPHHVLHYMQSIEFEPTLVVDVSNSWTRRNEAVRAYTSQFSNPDYRPGESEPETFVSNPAFKEWFDARAKHFGYRIGAAYGEPFLYRHGPIGTDDLVKMLTKEKPFR